MSAVDKITNLIIKKFRCFGKGTHIAPYDNPIAEATKNSEPVFALGVEVRTVVQFVINEYEKLK